MDFNTFNKKNLSVLRSEMDAALKEVFDRHGISMKFGGARYSDNNVSMKLELTAGSGVTPEVECFKSTCIYVGLKADDLGASFSALGKHTRSLECLSELAKIHCLLKIKATEKHIASMPGWSQKNCTAKLVIRSTHNFLSYVKQLEQFKC